MQLVPEIVERVGWAWRRERLRLELKRSLHLRTGVVVEGALPQRLANQASPHGQGSPLGLVIESQVGDPVPTAYHPCLRFSQISFRSIIQLLQRGSLSPQLGQLDPAEAFAWRADPF